LPVSASPPLPPVALASPPLTSFEPWSVVDSLLWEPEPPFSLSFDWPVAAALSTLALPPFAFALPPLPPVASPL